MVTSPVRAELWGLPQKKPGGSYPLLSPRFSAWCSQDATLRAWRGEGPVPPPAGLGAPGSPFAFFSLAPSSWRSSERSLTSGRAAQERGTKAHLGCSTLPCSFPKAPRAAHLRQAEGKETRKEIILVRFGLFPVLCGGVVGDKGRPRWGRSRGAAVCEIPALGSQRPPAVDDFSHGGSLSNSRQQPAALWLSRHMCLLFRGAG